MIKIENLMIGDWVKTQPGGIQRVLGLEEGHVIVKGISVVEDYVEPIPLTAEILEKNKMRVFEHRNPWQVANNLIKKWYSKDGSFYVSYYKVGDECTYTLGTNLSRICNIRYVHELQHALKLCCVKKEIVL